ITDVLGRIGAQQERRPPQPLDALAGAVRADREGAVEVLAEDGPVRAEQAEDESLALANRPRRLIAKLANTGPAGLGGVELLQDGSPPRPVVVGLLDPALEVIDLSRQL